MTSFAFILGTVPLAIATGAGAGARTALGTAVVFGMLWRDAVGVFFTPVFYVLLQRVSERQWPFRRAEREEVFAHEIFSFSLQFSCPAAWWGPTTGDRIEAPASCAGDGRGGEISNLAWWQQFQDPVLARLIVRRSRTTRTRDRHGKRGPAFAQ